MPVCYRHPDRESHIRCQRCERPICPDCMRPASVGFQCPSCVAEGAKSTRSGRTTYGGRRSDNPALTSQVIIGINAVVWVLQVAVGGSWVVDLALVPNGPIVLPGGVVVPVLGVADGAYWQLVTSMFLHNSSLPFGVMHIGFNMFALWLFGPQLEALFGRTRFLALYFLSGLAGSAAVYWLSDPGSLTLGASGAIFGLFAAYLLVALKMKTNVTQLLVLLVLNIVISFRGNISWQGHLGGFIGGAAIAAILMYAPRGPRRALWQGVGLAAVAVLLLVAVAARTFTFTAG